MWQQASFSLSSPLLNNIPLNGYITFMCSTHFSMAICFASHMQAIVAKAAVNIHSHAGLGMTRFL